MISIFIGIFWIVLFSFIILMMVSKNESPLKNWASSYINFDNEDVNIAISIIGVAGLIFGFGWFTIAYVEYVG